ncbi:Fc.00g023080.m01.CDS01 [Cosmosporella sp. VM-42]
MRPNLSLEVPSHSRFMEPSCDVQFPRDERKKTASLSLYIPYLNWDTHENFVELTNAYAATPRFGHGTPMSVREKIQRSTSSTYLSRDLPLHPRRSLDQYYYPSLRDTGARDADQTVSKWTGSQTNITENGRHEAAPDSLIAMVDQLWIFLIDKHSIVTFFPSHELQLVNSHSPATSSSSTNPKFHDLYSAMMLQCQSCWNIVLFTRVLVETSVTSLFRLENRKFADLLGIYRWAIGNKSARQTAHFQDFHRVQSGTRSTDSDHDSRAELKLALEVADILDEINMLHRLMEKQQEVVKSLYIKLRDLGYQGDYKLSPLLEVIMEELRGMRSDAEHTHKMLLDLLDLKQKAASLAEVRSSTKQGRAVMLFTIFTVIFLPLSFFSSYFGQNVSEISGDDKNPTSGDLWKIGGPISVAVILCALLVAYYISNPESRLWNWGHCWKTRREASQRQVC